METTIVRPGERVLVPCLDLRSVRLFEKLKARGEMMASAIGSAEIRMRLGGTVGVDNLREVETLTYIVSRTKSDLYFHITSKWELWGTQIGVRKHPMGHLVVVQEAIR